MNSLILTEKQQEVLWLRYNHKASINQIATWLKISRRAVLARLRNARRRTGGTGPALPPQSVMPAIEQRFRTYAASQISVPGTGCAMQMDEL